MGTNRPALAVIGGGAMATAILEGAGRVGRLPERVCVAEPDPERRGRFLIAVESAAEAMRWLDANEDAPGSGQLLLAVKPQMLEPVAAEVGDVGDRVVVSILAGMTGKRIRDSLGGRCRVVRVMPNTPAQIGRGTTAIAVSAGASDGDAVFARELFRGVGDVVIELDESMMDAFTAVAGSGPAYVFYLFEAMRRGAEAAGFDTETATRIVASTIAGAAELMCAAGEDPAELRDRVTSKGGTTQAAISVLDDAGVMETVERAIVAARDRGCELGGG